MARPAPARAKRDARHHGTQGRFVGLLALASAAEKPHPKTLHARVQPASVPAWSRNARSAQEGGRLQSAVAGG